MKILKRYKRTFIRPILYRSITWGSIALALALCWNRFVNVGHLLSVGRDAFLVVGAFFLMLGWFTYLKVDGVAIPRLHIGDKKKKPMRHSYGDMIDFADEHIVTFDELDDEEQDLCRLATNVILGVFFLIISFLNL